MSLETYLRRNLYIAQSNVLAHQPHSIQVINTFSAREFVSHWGKTLSQRGDSSIGLCARNWFRSELNNSTHHPPASVNAA